MGHKNKIKRLYFGYDDFAYSDWTNINVIKKSEGVLIYNLNLWIPFFDESFDVIYIRDILERVSEERSKNFLYDCIRALRLGGMLRIAIKDLERICRSYLNEL